MNPSNEPLTPEENQGKTKGQDRSGIRLTRDPTQTCPLEVRVSVHFNLPIQNGLSAAVQVIKLLFGNRVIDIHGRNTELPSFGELIQPKGRRSHKNKQNQR